MIEMHLEINDFILQCILYLKFKVLKYVILLERGE